MDNPLVLKKLESLKHCIERLESRRPEQVEILKEDYDLQDIISVNLERAVQICVDICAILIAENDFQAASTMAGNFEVLETAGMLDASLSYKLQKAVGFRNIAVHEYEKPDWNLVYDIIHNHLKNFRDFAGAILKSS